MPMTPAEVEQALLARESCGARAPQDEVDAAWRHEISGRIEDIRNGRVELIPAEDAFTRIRAKLATRRQ